MRSFGLLIHRRYVQNLEKAMIVFSALILPLVTILVIFIFQQRSDHIIHGSLSSDGCVIDDEMWLILHPIPDKLMPYMVVSLRHLRKARKVSVEVMPLHIGNAEGYKHWRHVLRKEASLSMEVVTLVPPKGTCSG